VFANASEARGVKLLMDMDAQTRADIGTLTAAPAAAPAHLPCEPDGSGTLKCEGCVGGCQDYDAPGNKGLRLANERTHYVTPDGAARAGAAAGVAAGAAAGDDVILYRSHAHALHCSVRRAGSKAWSTTKLTSVPNCNSNINAGVLPLTAHIHHANGGGGGGGGGGSVYAGGAFLVSNAAAHAPRRDPLTLSLTADGFNFSSCRTVQTCFDLRSRDPRRPWPHASNCTARLPANKNSGPSYPQALSVVAPAPAAVQGLYVVATNNKEDVIITRLSWESVLI
jgi:hypothetical protein